MAAIAAIGCGGDSSPPTVSTSSLTKADFVKRAEEICARGRTQGLQYQGPPDSGQSEKEANAERIEATLLPAIQEVIDEIYALGAPSGEATKVEGLLVALQQAVSTGEELDAPSLDRVEELLERPGKLAQEYGLETCVYG